MQTTGLPSRKSLAVVAEGPGIDTFDGYHRVLRSNHSRWTLALIE
jgi:hypothetical protein